MSSQPDYEGRVDVSAAGQGVGGSHDGVGAQRSWTLELPFVDVYERVWEKVGSGWARRWEEIWGRGGGERGEVAVAYGVAG